MSDKELNELVAIHVAGLRRGIAKNCEIVSRWYDKDGNSPIAKDYATSADAVLPLLEKLRERDRHEISIIMRPDGEWWVSIGAYGLVGSGTAPTFPRSACLALLQAHGVAIE